MYIKHLMSYSTLFAMLCCLTINAENAKLDIQTDTGKTVLYDSKSKKNPLEQLLESGINSATVKDGSETTQFLQIVRNQQGEPVAIRTIYPATKRSFHTYLSLLTFADNNRNLPAAVYAFINSTGYEQHITVNGKPWKCIANSACYDEKVLEKLEQEKKLSENKIVQDLVQKTFVISGEIRNETSLSLPSVLKKLDELYKLREQIMNFYKISN